MTKFLLQGFRSMLVQDAGDIQIPRRHLASFGRGSLVFGSFFLFVDHRSCNSALCHMPSSAISKRIDRTAKAVLSSHRYAHLKGQIYQPLRTAEFQGYWICRGLAPEAIDPKTSDVLILYIHRGGYVTGHPGDSVTELLVVAETLAKKGVSTSIFSLDYTLAPRATLPTQIQQALAAYRHLIEQVGIDASKVVVMGDSSGGHLVLSMLTALARMKDGTSTTLTHTKDFMARNDSGTITELSHVPKHDSKETIALPKPGYAVLVSPWIDLSTRNPQSKSYADRDILSKRALDTWRDLLLYDTSQECHLIYGDFGDKVTALRDLLPSKIWMSAGGDELFLPDIEEFADYAQHDGVDATLDVTWGCGHSWQTMDGLRGRKKWLALREGEGPPELMRGQRGIANAIFGMLQPKLTKN